MYSMPCLHTDYVIMKRLNEYIFIRRAIPKTKTSFFMHMGELENHFVSINFI